MAIYCRMQFPFFLTGKNCSVDIGSASRPYQRYSHLDEAPPGAFARVASPERRRSREKKLFFQPEKTRKKQNLVHLEKPRKTRTIFFKATVACGWFEAFSVDGN